MKKIFRVIVFENKRNGRDSVLFTELNFNSFTEYLTPTNHTVIADTIVNMELPGGFPTECILKRNVLNNY